VPGIDGLIDSYGWLHFSRANGHLGLSRWPSPSSHWREVSRQQLIVSGGRHLLDLDGYRGIEKLKPGPFVDKYLLD
jgi:hypothetical protein